MYVSPLGLDSEPSIRSALFTFPPAKKGAALNVQRSAASVRTPPSAIPRYNGCQKEAREMRIHFRNRVVWSNGKCKFGLGEDIDSPWDVIWRMVELGGNPQREGFDVRDGDLFVDRDAPKSSENVLRLFGYGDTEGREGVIGFRQSLK
jgi:hypothetical protein